MPKCFVRLIPLLLGALSAPLAAQDAYVPAELEPWRNWVLEGHEYRACPFLFDRSATERGDYVCAWPGVLSIDVDASGGRFSQSWTVYGSEQWIALPGDANLWPEAVRVGSRAAEVVLRGGLPSVYLGAGRHELSGRFDWERRPQTLAIPSQSGLLSLSIDGRRIARIDRNESTVWLGERSEQKAEQDAVQVQVYRLLEDGVPAQLTTAMVIEVAGSVRESLFGPLLPADFVPLAIHSDLPARLEADGSLRLQLRPGRWNLRVRARAPGVVNDIAMPSAQKNLPDTEIWSYRSNDTLRVTAVEGANPVDPDQVDVPGEWQALPAFRLQAGDGLTLAERSRGKLAADNQLELDRQLWLDFSGDGFVYADSIHGEMRSGWRLDMAAPWTLLSASEAGANLLVTRMEAEGPSGIEVRQTDAEIEALGRLETRDGFAATGWDARFDAVSITLNLPPGQRLFAAPGVDEARGSWIGQWQLLDFFLVLIVTIATARLFGNAAAVVALIALALTLHEYDSAGWSWLNLLAAVALVRVAPQGWLAMAARGYRLLSLIAVVLVVVPFMIGQIHFALHPQLELRTLGYAQYELDYGESEIDANSIYPASAPPARDMATREKADASLAAVEEIVVTGARKSYSRYADNAIVQAGPGKPSWEWNEYQLEFSGPVDVDRTLRLVIVPRWLVSLLRCLAVLSIAGLLAMFAFETVGRTPRWRVPGGLRIGATPAAVLAILLGGSLLQPAGDAKAETPSPQILQELQQRLLARPDCSPRCAEVISADVRVTADSLSIVLSVNAMDEVAVPLPGSMNGWRAESVSLGNSQATVMRGDEGNLWVQVPRGHSSVTMRGPLPPVASVEVPFPAPPRVVTSESDGWLVAGIRDRRLVSGSLQLTRLQRQGDDSGAASWELSRLPVFVRIERQVEFDLDWRVNTTVFRVAPEQGALTIEVPLIEGESIVSGEFKVVDGNALVAMSQGEYSVSWTSTLPRQSPLTLTAAANTPWSEVWRFDVGSVWHAEFDGIPESESRDRGYDVRTAEFYPRGGESLTVHAERPEGVPGNTLAFDSVSVETTLGRRSSDSQLSLQYRSTRGAQHRLVLPDNADVLSVAIDGRSESMRAIDGELSLPILPGEHSIDVSWRTDGDIGFRAESPAVELGSAAGNITLVMQVPENRWILFTGGPQLGPAVLYWSQLVALLLIAVVLGRFDVTPLRTWHWILLGLGFSTFSWIAFATVVVWLLVSGARHRWRPGQTVRFFNLMQVGFVLLTIIALSAIVTSLPAGLLGRPEMHIDGFRSFGYSLRWFADRTDSILPQASVFTAPLWLYKVLILAWALWLSFALIRWLPWVWHAFAQDGLWRPWRRNQKGTGANHE
jgi:hypothetical protein